MPKVLIPPPYRGPTQGTSELEVDGATVRGCIEAVERKFPGFQPFIVDEDGNLLKFVTLVRNGERLAGDSLATALDPEDELEIISAVAGG